MPLRSILIIGLLLTTAAPVSAQDGNRSPHLYAAWFANGSLEPDRRYDGRPEDALPKPTREFSKSRDRQALFIVVLNDPKPHKIKGELRDAAGTPKRQFSFGLAGAAPDLPWRPANYRLRLERLDPGDYTLAVAIDDTFAGVYRLSITP